MKTVKRQFQDVSAVRTRVPILFGIAGPSGSGKTYSAMRVATGIRRVVGGEIYVIDTEANRALHYAPKPGEQANPLLGTFEFRHVPFGAPFSPLDYLAAMEHCVRKGAKTIIVDSFSHEHEGPGGVLEMHDKAVEDRYQKALKYNAKARRETYNYPAWSEPKAQRRRLINSMTQMDCNFILCFRAKEKAKPGKKGDKNGDDGGLIDMGWMPIGGEEILFEMMARALLEPNADGVPRWRPERPGEKQIFKLPNQFRDLFKEARALDERHGEAMARWAGEGAERSAVAPASTPTGETFVRHFKWNGQEEWGGKLLSDAPAEALENYAAAIEEAAAKAKPARAEKMLAHLGVVHETITAKSGDAFEDDPDDTSEPEPASEADEAEAAQ